MGLPLIEAHRRKAVSALPAEVAAFFEAGSWDEISASEAPSAWEQYRLRPRVLRDVGTVDTSVDVLGMRLSSPILVAPIGYQRLAHPDGEAEMARGAADAGSLLVVSTRSTVRLETIAAVGCPWWFQTYVMQDRRITEGLVERAQAAGATALVLTGDTPFVAAKRRAPVVPHLPDDVLLVNVADHLEKGADPRVAGAQDPSATLDCVEWLRELSDLPVLVKGVLRGDDAESCIRAGAAGVIVSNHGGRQLDRAVSTARALPEVLSAVGQRGEVFVDGGLRDGISIAVALALGARAVLIGRPTLWALAAGGAAAVTDVLDQLGGDLRRATALLGAASIDELEPTMVRSTPFARR